VARTAAALVLLLALATTFGEVALDDPTVVAPIYLAESAIRKARGHPLGPVQAADQRLTAWLVARNAHTLWSQPGALFEAEHCFPAANSLAYGEPVITLGVLGIPASLLWGDPIGVYNSVLVLVALISALAMTLLVKEWTGSLTAGCVAGLLYAFHAAKLGDTIHPYVDDTAWTVFALYFARRLFAERLWRDAVGLAVACALQIGGSFYPFLSAVLLALPFGIWLVLHTDVRRLPLPQLALVGIVVLGAAAVVFGPYLQLRTDEGLAVSAQYFSSWRDLLPGARHFPGLLALGLAGAALVFPRSRSLVIDGDPRWAIACGGLLVMIMATGGNSGDQMRALAEGAPRPVALPSLYHAIAPFIPGLDMVRVPGEMDSGFFLALALLAGVGAAAVLHRVPPRTVRPTAVALVVLSFLEVRGPPLLAPTVHYELTRLAPSKSAQVFFAKLAELGNTGPLLEVPAGPSNNLATSARISHQVLVTAYHGRPTSECRNSHTPAVVAEVRELSLELPDPGALARLRSMGFTTIVVHHHPSVPRHRRIVEPYLEAAATPEAGLRWLHSDSERSAFLILP